MSENWTKLEGIISHSSSIKPTTGCRARSTSLWIHRNLFWQVSRDGNLHGFGMSHSVTASPKSFFRAAWRVGDYVSSRGNAGWTTSKSGHSCLCQNCSRGPPVEQTGRGSLPNHPACSPYNPIGQGTELNWTFSIVVLMAAACSVSCLECTQVTWTASGRDFYQRHHICSNLWDKVQVFVFFCFSLGTSVYPPSPESWIQTLLLYNFRTTKVFLHIKD